jgi:hypothetical protein
MRILHSIKNLPTELQLDIIVLASDAMIEEAQRVKQIDYVAKAGDQGLERYRQQLCNILDWVLDTRDEARSMWEG